jgi:hypothetical protein
VLVPLAIDSQPPLPYHTRDSNKTSEVLAEAFGMPDSRLPKSIHILI